MLLEVLVNHENWLQMVNVFSLGSLSENIDSWRNVPSSVDFGEFSVHFKSEAAELLNVDRFAVSNVFIDIFNQTFPDNQHLGLGLKWLQVVRSPLSRVVMLSGVLVALFEDPIQGHVTVETYHSTIYSISILS